MSTSDDFSDGCSLSHLRRTAPVEPPTEKLKETVHPRVAFKAVLCYEKGLSQTKVINCSCDSGASSSVIQKDVIENLRLRNSKETKWTTFAGELSAGQKCKADFVLPEFSTSRAVHHNFHATNGKFKCNMIIGQDLMTDLGIDPLHTARKVHWQDASEVEMKMDDDNSLDVASDRNVLSEDDKKIGEMNSPNKPVSIFKKHQKVSESLELLMLNASNWFERIDQKS